MAVDQAPATNNRDSGAPALPPINVQVGPDLNVSRSPFDKKQYRQILLPNGLRVVLICDVVAMHQAHNEGGIFVGDEESSSDEGTKDDEIEEESSSSEEGKLTEDAKDNDGDPDDSFEEESAEDGGIRQAAAAMVVGVGSMYDPPECQGMAHFLEHLLFMGSEKYPEENAYDSFLSKHGGSDNAFTEMEYTVYHFDVPQEHLFGALDIFSGFFTNPLMSKNAVDRELNSIESEFQLVKNSDGCRAQQLMCHTCGHDDRSHPFAKFGWGNLQSLKECPEANNVDALKLLRSFYNKHYYASNMRLVVIGAFPLDMLQDQVIQCFSEVPAVPRGVPMPGTSPTSGPTNSVYSWEDTYFSPMKHVGMPFTQQCLHDRVFYVPPVKDRHVLSVTWQLPSQIDAWRSKPCDVLAHLLGHEAQGSLLASLKAKSWATGCCAGVGSEGYESASSHALFTLSITLSKDGVAHWTDVVCEIYRYVGMLRYHCQEGLPRWIFEELESIYEVAHRYGDEQSPEDLVETFAEELAPHYNTPPDRLLDGSALFFEYDPLRIQNIVNSYFTPKNARLDLASSTFGRSSDYETVEPASSDQGVIVLDPPILNESGVPDAFLPTEAGPPQKESFFGTCYWCQALPPSLLQNWIDLGNPQLPPPDSMLSLPPPNPYIPQNFDLKALPPSDCHHPLLNCSIKLQIVVGKKKQWFPATVTQFNSIKNQVLLSYEDEDEKWHKMDASPTELAPALLNSEFEGTMDNKKIKYRVVAFAMEGEGAVRKFGDESDYDVDDGTSFPAIPPALPATRLPKLVNNTNVLKLWHLQDRNFRRPIAELRLQIHCEAAKTPLHDACMDVLVHLISDALTQTAYLASVCELGSSLASNECGLSMRVHGFNDKLLDLFTPMLELLLSFRGRSASDGLPREIREGRFEAILEVYRRSCSNSGLKASSLSKNVRIRCLRPSDWSTEQKLKALADIDVATFTKTVTSVLHNMAIEGLYHGNVDAADAEKAKQMILEFVEASTPTGGGGLSKKKYPAQPVAKIPLSKGIPKVILPAKDLTDPNTAVELYIQIGKDNTKDKVMVDLLSEMMYEPLFDQVRTKDQFGYTVSCDARWTNGVIGIHFQIVTSSKSAEGATKRLDQFLREYRQELHDMSAEDFMEHLAGLAKQKLDMFNSLTEETDYLWGEIRDGRYNWQVSRDEVIALRNITHKETLKAYDKWFYPGKDGENGKKNNTKRRIFVVEVISSVDGPSSLGRPQVKPEEIEDFIEARVSEYRETSKKQTWGKIY